MDFLTNLDTSLFYFLNGDIANSLFDKVMPFITEPKSWTIAYIFLFGWLFWKGGKQGRIAAVTLIVAIVLADQLSSSVIKELVQRVRPCKELADVRMLVPCSSGLSFPSSHAANTFAGAVILSYYFRHYTWVYFTAAAAISFSRIYVGVHYPFDVLGGALLGAAIGIGLIMAIRRVPWLNGDGKKVKAPASPDVAD